MNYLISVDVKTDGFINRRTQDTLTAAVSTIITDNLDCEVFDVRFAPYGRLGTSNRTEEGGEQQS